MGRATENVSTKIIKIHFFFTHLPFPPPLPFFSCGERKKDERNPVVPKQKKVEGGILKKKGASFGMWLYEHYTHNLPAKRDYEKIKKNEGMLPYLPPPPF